MSEKPENPLAVTQEALTEAFSAVNWRIPQARQKLRTQLAKLDAEEAAANDLIRRAKEQAMLAERERQS